MLRVSMNEVTTYRWSFEEDVVRYHEAGYQAIGVWRRKLVDYGEEKGIDLLREYGLHVSNLLWAGGFTGSDGRSFEESIADAQEAIRLTAAMRAGCLVVCTGGRNNHIASHSRRLLHCSLDELLPLAELLGVTLALEPMHASYAEEWTVLNRLEHAVQIVNQYDSPTLRIAIDTYHIGHDPSALAALPGLADRIAVVHLADCLGLPTAEQKRCRLGKGSVPLDAIVSSLIGGGYQGDFDIELIGAEVEGRGYYDLLEHSKTAATELLACAGCLEGSSLESAVPAS